MKTLTTVTILIGPPCCGKSSYVLKHKEQFDYVISSDNIVTQICAQNKLNYADFFKLPHNHPLKTEHSNKFQKSINISLQKNNVVWDLTNLTIADRATIKRHYSNARFIAIEFNWQSIKDELLRRNKQRAKTHGKVISEDVILMMFNKYQPVSAAEMFHKVIHV